MRAAAKRYPRLHRDRPAGPGPLAVVRHRKDGGRQATVVSDHTNRSGEFDDVYVEFSGFFGSYGPHVFAAAPELLEALKRLTTEAVADEMHKRPGWDAWVSQANEAIAKAEGRS